MQAAKPLYISWQNHCVDYDCQEKIIIAIIEAADSVCIFLTQTGDGLSGASPKAWPRLQSWPRGETPPLLSPQLSGTWKDW